MIRKGVIVLFFVLATGSGVQAAALEPSELDAGGLIHAATRSLAEEDYISAIPYLEEYLKRMAYLPDPRVMTMCQEVRLKLAKVMAWMENYEGAADYLTQYTQNLPRYKPREAYLLLAVNLYESARTKEEKKEGDPEEYADAYGRCIDAVTNALANPMPALLKEEKKKVNYDEMTKDQMGGFTARQMKRLERKIEKKGGDLTEALSDQPQDPEADFTVEELVLLNMTLAEARAKLQRWEESLAPYNYVISNTQDEFQKGYAILQLVNALLALEKFDEAKSFILQLYRTDARYNIRVNMALVKTAEAFYIAGEYDSSLMLFRMIVTREKMVAYQEGRMNQIRRNAGLPDVELSIVTNELGRVDTVFGNKSAAMLMSTKGAKSTDDLKLPVKPMELVDLEEAVGKLIALPPYEDNVLYEVARLYAAAGRPWEAVVAFDIIAKRLPDSEVGQRAFAESLLVLTDPLKEYERVETLAKQYLASHISGLGPRMVAYSLTSCYQKQERWTDIKGLVPVIQGFEPSKDTAVRQYEGELYFMQAIADLMLLNYEQAEAEFAALLRDYPEPGSVREENVNYWLPISRLFLKKYDEALSGLAAYAEAYPEGSWLPSSTFYSGVCLFSLERYDEAQARFTKVIDTWPDASVYSDACSMRGDLLAAKGGDLLDAAQADYERAIASAKLPRQATYAVFQMATMFSLEKRNDEIINAVQAYLDQWGDQADVSKAAYWIGKTRLAQGRTGEAVDTYLNTIVKYGGNIQQDGVDMIIAELNNLARRLKTDDRDQLKGRIQAAADSADNGTLRLRLRVLLAKMDRAELELGKTLIKELPDLTQAPPPVLSVICEASLAAGDYSRSAEILRLFQTRYDESDFIRAAYKLRAKDLYQQGDLAGVMGIVADAQARYGTDPDVAWAQLMKGRVELKGNQFDAARKTFEDLLSLREWRGEPYAEATYALGQLYEQEAEAWASGQLPQPEPVAQTGSVEQTNTVAQLNVAEQTHSVALTEPAEQTNLVEQLNSDEQPTPVPVLSAEERQEKVTKLIKEAFAWYQRCYVQYRGYTKGYWAAESYLASARCLQKLGLENDRRNTFRAMLFDKYVNKLPQAEFARKELGAEEVQEITDMIAAGTQTNLTVKMDGEGVVQ